MTVTNLQEPERLLVALLVAVAAETPGAHRTAAVALRAAARLGAERDALRAIVRRPGARAGRLAAGLAPTRLLRAMQSATG